MNSYINELNERISNPTENISSEKGFEIITESLVYKVYDVFGRNSLLSILYQTGAFPGATIAERIKKEYNKEEFEIVEALVILMDELKDFYSIVPLIFGKNGLRWFDNLELYEKENIIVLKGIHHLGSKFSFAFKNVAQTLMKKYYHLDLREGSVRYVQNTVYFEFKIKK